MIMKEGEELKLKFNSSNFVAFIFVASFFGSKSAPACFLTRTMTLMT